MLPEPRILCVDPDARVTSGLTGLLEREGFQVDVEHDGHRALKLALAGGYDAIVTEIDLPGAGGLDIAKALRRERPETAVVLLTATPAVATAIEATRLDALYLTKSTATLAEIVGAIRRAAAAPATQAQDLFAAREMLEIDRGSLPPGALAKTLLRPELTFPQFVCAAADLKAALGDPEPRVSLRCPAWTRVDPLVREAVRRIEQAGPRWALLSERTLATELSIRTAAVWRLLHGHLGLGFLECRRAVVMRRAVRDLTAVREQVAQVAYGLGYEHASSFNRDFRRFFRASPTTFRRLARVETVKD